MFTALLTVYEATTLAATLALLLLGTPHVLSASGIPRARRLRPPTLSLALVAALRGVPAALEVVGRTKGLQGGMCAADSVLTTFLTAAAVAHLPAIACTAYTRLETPTHKPRPLTPAFYAALIGASLAFALSHAVAGAVAGGAQWWGYYCANDAWWWRYARLSLLFPPALTLLLCVGTATTLYASAGNPNPRIAPTWRQCAGTGYLAACSAGAIAYLALEAAAWRADWWPRVLEALIGPAAAAPLLLNVHVWRAYGAWVRGRRPPRTQRLSFEVNAVLVTAGGGKRASLVVVVDAGADAAPLPSPTAADPFAAAPPAPSAPAPAPREFVPILGAEVEYLPPIAEDERGSKLSLMSVGSDAAPRPTSRVEPATSPYSARFYGSPRRASATSAASLPFVYALSEDNMDDDLRRFPMDFPLSAYSDLSLRPPSGHSLASAYSDDVEAQSAESHLRLNSTASRHVAQSSDSLSILDLEGSVIVVNNAVDRRPSMEVPRIVNLSRQ